MIYNKGNLLDVNEGIILHGCNAQGVMGSGVALAFKKKFPEAYYQYLSDHKDGLLTPGYISIYQESPTLILASGITQKYYGRDPSIRYVDYEAIREIFRKLEHKYPGRTVHIPKLGAGYGNGDWDIIEEIIDSTHRRVVCWEL